MKANENGTDTAGHMNLGAHAGNRMMLEKNVGPGYGDAGDSGNLVIEGVQVLKKPSHEPFGTIQFPDDKDKSGAAGAKAPVMPAVPLKPAQSDAATVTATAASGDGAQNPAETPSVPATAPTAAPATERKWTFTPIKREIPKQKHHFFTEEAYAYWMTPLASGAFSPSTYVRRSVVQELYELRGKKPLGIADAKGMVQLDGEPIECAVKKKVFQPVKYLVEIQPSARKAIRNGVPLSAGGLAGYLFFGGCFYVVESKDKAPYAVALSGSKFILIDGQFVENRHSPLMNFAKMFSQHSGKPQWGITRAAANSRVERLIEDVQTESAMKELFTQIANAPAPDPNARSWRPIPKAK